MSEPITDANALAPDLSTMNYQQRNWYVRRLTKAMMAGELSVEMFWDAYDKYDPFREAVEGAARYLYQLERSRLPWWKRWLF